jgi:hypothetical protein
MHEMNLQICGLGFIMYSEPAVAHIPIGADYLQEHFWQGVDVARHVMQGGLTTFCTGTPGRFKLRFTVGEPNENAVEAAEFKLRLALDIQGGVLCVRDLYDLMHWSSECPKEQQLAISDGWYRLTVFSSSPDSGILGDGQTIDIRLEPTANKPRINWDGVPHLC